MITDLTYTEDWLFTRFWPETPEGEKLWNEIARQNDGTATVLTIHAPAVIQQIRAAGFKITKARRKKVTAAEMDKIYKELEDLK